MTLLAEPQNAEPSDKSSSTASIERPSWARPALITLLLATAALYLWGLWGAGWANEFYAAAVQAGTQSWKAFLFGSLDSGNAITVDKPPAALWVMVLSCRIFGFSTFAMLAPQALMGVGSVALLYATVRRTNGYGAGLLAGAALAATPVAALMFRFNNPDALLVLLLVVAAYCTVRALDGSSSRWLALAGAAIGFAFLAKLLQALLVVPALALVVLVAVPGSFWVRIRALLVGLVAMVVSAGWLIALVDLWPGDRPYIGGSTDNTLLQLTLGYNGLGRVFGGDGNPTNGPDGSGPGGPMFGGEPGIARMFDASMGTEISWLLPAALIGLVAGLWFTRRTPRTGRTRAALLLWGGWMLITVVVFSFMKGIMHPYYTVALAPGVAGVVGIAVAELWRGKDFAPARYVLAAMLAVTGVWNFILLDRTPDWLPWLRWAVLAGTIVVASVIAVGAQRLGRYTAAVAAAGILLGAAGTAAYAIETAGHTQGGGIPISGPGLDGGDHFGGDGRRDQGDAGANADLHQLLVATDNRWAAATIGSHVAGALELYTATSVMAIGGFNGADPSPTLEQFQQYVADGDVRYFVAAGQRMPGMEKGTGADITEWVEANFTAQVVDGTTIYDLAG